MSRRTLLKTFHLANPLYIGSLVNCWAIDANGDKTSTLITLYANETGTDPSDQLANPQTLDSYGKFKQPVYFDEPFIASVVGVNIADYDTGIVYTNGIWRGTWATATVYYPGDTVREPVSEKDIYVVNTRHTSGTFATDVTNLDLELMIAATAAVGLVDDQWLNSLAATYVSTTTFTLVGDQTTEYHTGRPIKNTGGADRYSDVLSSAFTTLTTVTVINTTDGAGVPATLHASMSTSETSILSADTKSANKNYYKRLPGEMGVINTEHKHANVSRYGLNATPGTTDMTAAITAADIVAAANRLYLTGEGTLLIESQLTLTSRLIDLRKATIQMDASFPSTEGVIIASGNNEIIDIHLNVDGDKDNQSGGNAGVIIRDVSTGTSQFHINAIDCKTGTLVDGNSERLNIHVGGYLCDLAVNQKINTNTPDENNYWISGGLCDMWYKQEDNTSANVKFNVENNTGATDYAVKILGAKYVSLSGVIRASVAGGVYIDVPADHMVDFQGLSIYSVSGGYALYALQGRTLTGNVNIRTVSAGGAFIGFWGGGVDLNVTVDSLTGGSGLVLGEEGVKAFRFGRINYSGYGNAGAAVGVDVDSVSGHLTLDMTVSDHTLRTNKINGTAIINCSTRHISGDIEISINDETPIINFVGGGITTTELAAYSYPAVGMTVDATTDATAFLSPYRPASYNGGNWSNTINTVTAGSPTLVTNGIVYLNSNGGAITATLPDANVLYQRVMIYMSEASNASTVTVTNHETSDPEVFTFNSTSDRLILEWTGGEWITVANYNVAV